MKADWRAENQREKQMTQREQLLQQIAQAILALPRNRVVLVGIDGDAGAGKSTFGDELQAVLQPFGRPVVRASLDDFHHPRAIRYRRGRTSPEGFFLDSFDYDSLASLLLAPLSPGGSRHYRRVAFDHRTDCAVPAPEEQAEPDSILVFDGMFLHAPELAGYWDYSVFLDVTPRTGLMRCAMRGDGSPDPAAESNFRYVEGQKLYLRECQPKKRATVVIDNEDWDAPVIRLNGSGRAGGDLPGTDSGKLSDGISSFPKT